MHEQKSAICRASNVNKLMNDAELNDTNDIK